MIENLRPVNAGLCAFGMSGYVFHAPFLQCLPEFNLSAVVERHEKKAAKHYPEIHSYNSIDELMNDDSIELIVVNTPNVTHYDYAKQALLAGKHVIVEKPFTATLEQAVELVNLSKEQQRLLVVFQNRRWDSDFLAVKQVVEKGSLGKLIEAEFHYDRYTPEPSYKKHKEVPDPGVGLVFDLGPHIIDQAITLFNKPEAVFARLQTHRPGSLVNDYFEIKLLYPQFTSTLKSSLLAREPVPAYVLHGSSGSFQKSRSDVQEAELQKGAMPCIPDWGREPENEWGLLHTEKEGKVIRERIPSPQGCYQQFYKSIYSCLRDGKPSPLPLEDSLLNMRIIEAALTSQQEGDVVKLT